MADSARIPIDFLSGLSKARVRWLLIGRQALIHYGVPVYTMDYDLWADPTPANIRKLFKVAERVGLQPADGSWEARGRSIVTLIYQEDAKFDVFLVRNFVNLDGDTLAFSDAYKRKVVARMKGDPFEPLLPAVPDLKLLKRMRDSEKDREDLRYLDLLIRKGTPPR